MAVPRPKEARRFYRCGKQRLVEAQVLQKADLPSGAVYLAGYGVECALKALILSIVPEAQVQVVLDAFRGSRAHSYNWLRDQYRLRGGAAFPAEVNRAFTLVNQWSTELRYEPAAFRQPESDEFLAAANLIVGWAEGRL